MAKEKQYVFVNNTLGRFTINFQGVFKNKWAYSGKNITLTEEEYEFAKGSYPHIFGVQLKPLDKTIETEGELTPEVFFGLSAAKQKQTLSEMTKDQLEAAIGYAAEKGIENKAAESLQKRLEELGE